VRDLAEPMALELGQVDLAADERVDLGPRRRPARAGALELALEEREIERQVVGHDDSRRREWRALRGRASRTGMIRDLVCP
jgi:hypothetical protein